jgi:hypothetical protein
VDVRVYYDYQDDRRDYVQLETTNYTCTFAWIEKSTLLSYLSFSQFYLVTCHCTRLTSFQMKHFKNVVSVPETTISLAPDVHWNRCQTLYIS